MDLADFALHRWTRRSVLTLGGLALAGCTGGGDGATRPAGTSFGIVDWVGYTPLYIAREKGYLPEAFNVRNFPSPGQGTLAFAGGKLEGGAEVTAGAVDVRAKGKDLRVVMVVDRSVGGDGILARHSIRDLADLKGRKVALELGSVSHFFFLQAIAGAGLSGRDITIINTPPDAAGAAYRSGQVEAAVTYAPYLGSANRAQADGRILFDSARLPDAISDIYVFDARFVQAHPEVVQGFVDAVLKGLADLQADPQAGYALTARLLNITPAEVEDYLRGLQLADLALNIDMLTNPNSKSYLPNALQSLARFLKDQGQIPAVPDLTNVVDPRFVLAARATQR
ncbi:ABC transporter substrate-binding protein [Gloeobacter violaceus]|uniref:Gll0175 protein n=1 Tax=Gloeobacter violaceus (strain ATCC 29082 / PCC 7421) TaxID=251221 RepID=Q7NP82_GLOVI|nr:ABC transporter substrate-binding protein [Gloeobacter violaceus]BAC88116.1 gll0175 [Gloeobacter violaceus PCC 7421]